jgi:hypothetical protein
MSIGALSGTIFALIIILVLVAVGLLNIRKGSLALAQQRRSATDGQRKAWHQQVVLLFGINNIVFATLVAAVIPLLLTKIHTVQYSAIIVIVLLLIVSLVLIIRCITVALRTSQETLAARQLRHASAQTDGEPLDGQEEVRQSEHEE